MGLRAPVLRICRKVSDKRDFFSYQRLEKYVHETLNILSKKWIVLCDTFVTHGCALYPSTPAVEKVFFFFFRWFQRG